MSSFQSPFSQDVANPLPGPMRDHWRVFLTEGIILTLLGLIAIFAPLFAGLFTTVFLGWLLLIAGVVGLVSTFRARQAPGFGWALLSALVALFAGGLLLWRPFEGLVTLTFVLTAFFILDGIFMIVLAITHRRELSGKWEWLMVNGVIDLILALLILSGLPGSLIWALGLILGIDMVSGGVALTAMALAARKSFTAP